jgi:dTDP-4-amino-4,6-dideoxygalactose transaminase
MAMIAPMVGDAEIEAVTAALRSGQLAQGAQVGAFEASFAEVVGGRHCVAVNSGTSALQLTLQSLGVGPGDEVIVPSFTFAATANAVRLVGAEPVFVDIEPHWFGLDPDATAAAVTSHTAAVMPVDLFGHPAALVELARLCQKLGLALVEDAAQAHGASQDGRACGAWGDGAAFSFYATKNMTTGEGGMVVVADSSAARTARLLRNQGMERQYENELVGYNMRMTDVAAAMGRVQLGRLTELNDRRRVNAARLTKELATDDLAELIQVPTEAPGAFHVYHQYTVRIRADRDGVATRLAELGVPSRVFYPTPVHRLAPYATADHLPETERAAAEVLSLPVGPHLGPTDMAAVAAGLRKALGR